MKKILLFGISMLLLVGGAAAAERIVFVDLARVFDDFYKTKLAKSKIEMQQQDVEAERQIMVDEMNLMSEDADALKKEARDTTFSDEIRDSKRILFEEILLNLRAKEKEIQEFGERRKQQMQMQVSRMSQTIMDEIREAVIEYAKQEGLQAVVDRSARNAAVGVFLYTHPDVDITETILVQLNSKRTDVLMTEDLFEEPLAEEKKEEPSTEE